MLRFLSMGRVPDPTHKISDLSVHEVSLVDFPANERPFLLLKARGKNPVQTPEIIEAQTTLLTRRAEAAVNKALSSPATAAASATELRQIAKEFEALADHFDDAGEADDESNDAAGESTEEGEADPAAETETPDPAAAGETPPAPGTTDIDKLLAALTPAITKAVETAVDAKLGKTAATPATPAPKPTSTTKSTPPPKAPKPTTSVSKGAPPRSGALPSNGESSDPNGTVWPVDFNEPEPRT